MLSSASATRARVTVHARRSTGRDNGAYQTITVGSEYAADEPSHSYAYALRPTRAQPLHIGDGGSTVDRRRGTRALI